jgi:MFS family permease
MKARSPQLIAFLTVAIDLLGFGIVLPLLPIYAKQLLSESDPHLRGLTLGALMSCFSFMQFLFSPAWGRLSDRIGRRPVLLIGLAGSVVFYALFGYASAAQSLLLMFLSRCGAGIAAATIGTAQAVIADCTPPERRAKGMALIGMAFGVGFTLGPIIGSFWVSDDQSAPLSAAPGYVAAALSGIALVVALLLMPETLTTESPQRSDWLNWQSWKLALGNRAIGVPVLTFFVATFAFGCFESTLALLTNEVLLYGPRSLFWLFAFVGVVLGLTQGLIVRRLVTRLGEIVMTMIGIALMVGGMLGLGTGAYTATTGLIMGSVVVAVVGFAFLTPSVQALVSRRTSPARQGEVLGVNQAASAIARIVGPVLGNVLYGAHQLASTVTLPLAHALPFFASASLMLIALGFSLTLRRDETLAPDVGSSSLTIAGAATPPPPAPPAGTH